MSGPGPGAAPNPPSPPEGRRERRAAGPAVPPAGPRSLPAPAAQRSPGAPLLPSAPPPAGGYEAFSSACSELCTKPAAPTGLSLPLSASSAPGSADSGCSSCGTPLYDQVSWGGGERGGGLLRRALCDPPSEANRFSALFLL